MNGKFGVSPFFFRGKWHFFVYPALAFGSGFVPEEFWENRPEDCVIASMSEVERKAIHRAFGIGWKTQLTINRAFFGPEGTHIKKSVLFRLVMARTDLVTTVALLKYQPDELWNALYHAHQAAEKALKAVLHNQGVSDQDLRGLSHNLGSALRQCELVDDRFSRWRGMLPYMTWRNEWRYEPYNFSELAVTNMFEGAQILLSECVSSLLGLPVIEGGMDTQSSAPAAEEGQGDGCASS